MMSLRTSIRCGCRVWAGAAIVSVMAGALNAIVLTSALDSSIDKRLIVRGYLRSFAKGCSPPVRSVNSAMPTILPATDDASYGLGLAVLLLDKGVTFAESTLAGVPALVYFGRGRSGYGGNREFLLRHKGLFWHRVRLESPSDKLIAGFRASPVPAAHPSH